MIKKIIIILFILLVNSNCFAAIAKINNSKIVFPDNTIKIIKGFGATNGVYSNTELDQVTVSNYWLTKYDYKELANAKVNTIRFYIQYHWLDIDQSEIFFEHFDQQIILAKKYNIYLIPNLHYFGNTNNAKDDHFYKGSNKYNPVLFWKKFSNQYKNEEQILAYDLINEPTCHEKWREFELYSTYDNIIQAIRKKNDKHPIVISDPVNKINNLEQDFFWSSEAFLKIDDDNIIYSYHWYEPTLFTFQSLLYFQGMELGAQFPYNHIKKSKYISGYYNTKKISSTKGKWIKYKTGWIKPSRITKKGSHFVISLSATDSNGKVWFDDIVLEKKNLATGKITREKVTNHDFSQSKQYMQQECLTYPSNLPSSWYFQHDAESNNVYAIIDKDNDHSKNGSGSLLIDGSDASWSSNSWARWSQAGGSLSSYYKTRKNYEYRVTSYIKVEQKKTGSVAIHIETYDVEQTNVDANYIKNKISTYYVKWAKENNVPLFCSEFGITDPSNQTEYPAPANSPSDQIKWVKTMMNILKSSNQNWCYHSYKDYQTRGNLTFGLFENNTKNNKIINELDF